MWTRLARCLPILLLASAVHAQDVLLPVVDDSTLVAARPASGADPADPAPTEGAPDSVLVRPEADVLASDGVVESVVVRDEPPLLAWTPVVDEGEARGLFARALADSMLVPDRRLAFADSVVSPLDTLDMSLWERTWWGRGGVFRRVGLFPTHSDEPTDDLRQIAHVRRTMLRWHQTLGLVTVASMGATVVGGQIAASTGNKGFHEATLPVTIGLYSTTAALALLSPPKPIQLEGRGGIDSITIHRWLAVGHVAGMLITPLLAEDAGQAHYAMGYATFATFSAAMLTVTLLRR